jgi:branched-chain amino acid transport system ATP-binding protein
MSPMNTASSVQSVPPLMELRGINTYYGQMHVLQDVALEVKPGELVALLGGNACGKSTTLKTILGLVTPKTGQVIFDGVDVTGLKPAQRIRAGIAVVPENRRLFGAMSVLENLKMGAYTRKTSSEADIEAMYELFPKLAERRHQLAGTLSGGEQQMVAVARALMAKPRLLLMDEPSMGLSPKLVEQSFDLIADLHTRGVSMLVVEQNANMALSVADRGYVLQTGRVVLTGPAAELASDEELRRAYLGR